MSVLSGKTMPTILCQVQLLLQLNILLDIVAQIVTQFCSGPELLTFN